MCCRSWSRFWRRELKPSKHDKRDPREAKRAAGGPAAAQPVRVVVQVQHKRQRGEASTTGPAPPLGGSLIAKVQHGDPAGEKVNLHPAEAERPHLCRELIWLQELSHRVL